MSLKRSRQEMSKTKTKSVRVVADPTAVFQHDDDAVVVAMTSKDQTWYSGRELSLQLDDATDPLATAMAEGLTILLKDSYERPHVNVQEYLNAFVAYTLPCNGKVDTLRGLEQRVDFSHRQERSRARAFHMHRVLSAAAKYQNNWDGLAQVSRQSSAASKLFAMRMGRADARAHNDENHDNNNDAAQEIMAEHQQREEYQRRRNGPTKLETPSLAMAFAQTQQAAAAVV
ncbi:expressed unknown protein [Seminavis robusta]|uniref:Uncharacterized protein n=1 Tax=Seminavis robusta TaxID=568900 RepID=A0A9N8H596_9STRA|nr:expressed unknown protein [Seminavis robusta]|eukprot:Sro137_g064400.1 n/a (229) ;mRNA; r:62772-63458